MKNARWGLMCAVAVSVFVSCGCDSLPKIVGRAEYERLRSMERLNKRQAALISELLTNKRILASQLDAERRKATGATDALSDKQLLVEMQLKELQQEKTNIQQMKQRISELEGQLADRRMPAVPEGLPENVKAIYDPVLGVGISIPGTLLFGSGRADLKKEGVTLVEQIAAIPMIKSPENILRICGFTDSDPIKYSSRRGWKDNYQLSGARAHTVLMGLKKAGIEEGRMHYVAFGPHRLIMENGKENKAKSRRVEIYFIPLTEKPGE